MSSPASDLSLNSSEGFDNDYAILRWLEAMVTEGCPPFDDMWKQAMEALQRVAAEQKSQQRTQQKSQQKSQQKPQQKSQQKSQQKLQQNP
jgi:NADH:ubiquinone oxidoreductase subunit B-like Fe-S oxidoreductase